MNNHNTLNHCVRLSLLAATLTTLTAASPSFAQQEAINTKSRAIVTSVNGDDQDVIEVRIEDGKVTVKRNGEEVPDAQIRREGGRFIILDEHGKAVNEANVWLGDDEHGSLYRFDQIAPLTDALTLYQAAAGEIVPKVMIGVQTAKPGPALEKHLRLEPGRAIMISGLYEGMPADEAGLQQYDIVIRIDGQPLEEDKGIVKALADRNAGDKVKLGVIHEGQPKDVVITLVAYDASRLRESKLIGGTPMMSLFTEGVSIPSLEGIAEIPKWQGFVYSPEQNQLFQRLEGLQGDQKAWRGAIEAIPRVQGAQKDIDARLQRLDDRMAELEKLLGKLVEQNKSAR